MISKFLSKLKSILFKSSVSSVTPLKEVKKTTKSAKAPKTKSAKPQKTKSKKVNSKKIIETLTTLPGVGEKSAKALYQAGFKTTKSVIEADEKDLLAISGVGVNLVKKLKELK
jgi:predicted flap endonuclease-1-like 5' DNA nuclease